MGRHSKEGRVNRLVAALMVVGLAGCGGGGDGSTVAGAPSSLVIEDLVVGTGVAAASGDTVTVNYVGTFLDGRKFDASADHGAPFTFKVGAGQVIAGWDQGLPGMKVGGKRRLTIPSTLAYGPRGSGPIPPNTPLRFEIDLVSIAGK